MTINLQSIEKYKLPIGLSILGLVLIAGGILTSGKTLQKPKQFPKESLVESAKLISVDVSGAVKQPGVYQLQEGTRVEDVIKLAQGFADNANQEYISKYLNLAQKLVDGGKIYIPQEGEQTTVANVPSQVAGVNTKVNINSASQAEIEALPGIGPVTAAKIISGRQYQSIEELTSKKVVGNAVFEKIKDLVVVF